MLLFLFLLAPITGAITLDIDDRRTCLPNVLGTFGSPKIGGKSMCCLLTSN